MATMSSQPISLPNNSSNAQDYPMGSGSYTGSNGSFNPASYTRQFLGSPISWRAGSFGFGGRLYSGSPMDQLIGSLEAKPSSFGSDRDSILHALSAIDREGEFCRNFMCCGIRLNDMHALVEHFEEVHVIVVDHPNAPGIPQAHVQIPFNPQAIPSNVMPQSGQSFPRQSGQAPQLQVQVPVQQPQHNAAQQGQYPVPFDPDDMEMEMEMSQQASYGQSSTADSSPGSVSSAPTPPDTPVHTPLSAYPSPTNTSPKSFHPVPSQLGQQQPSSPYSSTSPYASQPPSPHNQHASTNAPVAAFDTTLIHHPNLMKPSSSSLAGATTDPNAPPVATRPNLNLNLTSFSRPASTAPQVLEPFNPFARYAADYSVGMPGANLEGDGGIDAGVMGMPSNHSPNAATPNDNCLPPALLFSHNNTPESTPATSRGPSPTRANNTGSGAPSPTSPVAQKSVASTSATASSSKPATPSETAAPAASAASLASRLSATLSRPATSLLLSKPFKCPKPNCNKSYKQANGLKYHLTHGSCNFAPPKDLEHVQAVLEKRRRDRAAAAAEAGETGENGDRSGSGALTPHSPLTPSDPSAPFDYVADLGQITESELREVEREAERRLRPFACGVGDCQRRYKNMNGLRYHYQHSGEHGAVGLAMLASGVHECLNNGNHNSSSSSAVGSGASSREPSAVRGDREGRKPRPSGKSSKPGSRATSMSRTGTPVSAPPTPLTQQYVQQGFLSAGPSPQAQTFSGANQGQTAATAAQAHLAYQQRFAEHQRVQYMQQQQQQQQAQAAQMQAFQQQPMPATNEAQIQQIQQQMQAHLAAFQTNGLYNAASMES